MPILFYLKNSNSKIWKKHSQKIILPKLNDKGDAYARYANIANSPKNSCLVKILLIGYQQQFGTPVTTTITTVSCAVTQERRGAACSATLPELMGHVTATATSSVKQVNYAHQVTIEWSAVQIWHPTSAETRLWGKRLAAMLAIYTGKGVTPEVNLRECIPNMPPSAKKGCPL